MEIRPDWAVSILCIRTPYCISILTYQQKQPLINMQNVNKWNILSITRTKNVNNPTFTNIQL